MTDNLSTLDAEARRAAQTDFSRPLVLEAGAGTGKTTTLVARILAWTLGPGWALEEDAEEAGDNEHHRRESIAARTLEGVAAVTFTEAAAAEMAARVASGLGAVADGQANDLPGFDLSLIDVPGPGVLEERARTLLGHLDRLEVRTIHAFCHGRLRAHPLELGLHPDFRIDPELHEIEELLRQVVEERTREAYAASDESPLLAAATLGVGPQELVEALLHLTAEAVPAGALTAQPFPAGRIAATRIDLIARIDEFFRIAENRLHAVKGRGNARLVAGALERTRELLDGLDPFATDSIAVLSSGFSEIWPKNLLNHLANWGKKGFNVSETTLLNERVEQLGPLCLPLRNRIRHLAELEPARLETFRRALEPLLAEAERLLRTTGLSHFSHILIETRRLFEEYPEVLASERRKIRQLLVDEFQDTDVVQCAIVGRLAFSQPPDESPGLFVVGDPKQSIYGWRNADLEAYEEFLAQVGEHGGRTYPLVQNFRSAPVLLTEVERVVKPVMREVPGLQPRFNKLLPSEKTRSMTGFQSGRWAPVESWVSWSPQVLETGSVATGQLEATEIEAHAVAQDIRLLHIERGVDWKDFGILFRSANRLDHFLDAFRRQGVPFVVTRDKQYFKRREIIDAAALFRLIVNPTDQVAMLTFLRSPLVGVPDAALIPLWRRDLPRLMVELDHDHDRPLSDIEPAVRAAADELPDEIPGLAGIQGWEANLLAGLDTLAMLRRSIWNEPPDLFVERLRRTTLLEAGEAARFLGQYRVANLDRFFRRLRLSLEESRGNIQAVLRSLRRSISEAHEAEEALPKDAAEDAVQIMTIHKAKGLEFRHVYLVQLDAKTRQNETERTDADRKWGPDGPEEYSLFGCPTLGFDQVRERRERVVAAEQVRVLYVALTRARERLVLSGNWKEGPGKPLGRSTPTFLSLLQQRSGLPESLVELATEAVDGSGFVDHDGLRWKFPGLQQPEKKGESKKEKISLPTTAAVAESSRRLLELQAAARLRMVRPTIGSASISSDGSGRSDSVPTFLSGERSAAQLVGIALHAALESWDLFAERDQELERQRQLVATRLAAQLPEPTLGRALSRARELLDRLRSGKLLERLTAGRDQVVARELPILLPVDNPESGPIAGVSGIADLVLRDPDDGQIVVVDFKTDQIDDDASIAERAEHYRPQLETYSQALEQALDLDYRPRSELWFIWPDTVWRSS